MWLQGAALNSVYVNLSQSPAYVAEAWIWANGSRIVPVYLQLSLFQPIYLGMDRQTESIWMAGNIPKRFTVRWRSPIPVLTGFNYVSWQQHATIKPNRYFHPSVHKWFIAF